MAPGAPDQEPLLDDDGMSEAQRCFYQHLFEAEKTRQPVAIESLCAARPELADEIRLLHESYRLAQGLVKALESPPELEPSPPSDVGSSFTLGDLLEPFRGERAYFVISTIAKGGFAVVERVWDGRLRRVLARKVLPVDVRPPQLPVPVMRRLSRFLAEAQIQSQLSHPSILPIMDVGIDDQGRPYYTMPLVHGEHFAKVIERVHGGEPGFSLARAVRVLAQTCDAMAYAHEKGVIHRDLKPHNVMVGRFGETFVMDWGLARVVQRLESASREKSVF